MRKQPEAESNDISKMLEAMPAKSLAACESRSRAQATACPGNWPGDLSGQEVLGAGWVIHPR